MQVSLPANTVVSAVARLYGVPLIGTVLGAAAATLAGGGDVAALLGAIAGAAAAATLTRSGMVSFEQSVMDRLSIRALPNENANR